MLVVEDAQFIDEASADLLRRLSRAGAVSASSSSSRTRTRRRRGRPSTTRDSAVSRFALARSRKEDATRSSSRDGRQPLSPDDVDEIARRSAGNPLFLFELLDMVRTAGTTDALPDSVESVIAGRHRPAVPVRPDGAPLCLRARLELRPHASRGRHPPGCDPGRRHLGAPPRSLVPQGNGTMRFKNSLVRDAAYEGLPFKRRRVLHERVGEAIEAMEDASLSERIAALALHFHEARRHEKAWRYCRDAGDRAKSIAANIEAARFYERALRSAAHLKTVTAAERAAVWVSSERRVRRRASTTRRSWRSSGHRSY